MLTRPEKKKGYVLEKSEEKTHIKQTLSLAHSYMKNVQRTSRAMDSAVPGRRF